MMHETPEPVKAGGFKGRDFGFSAVGYFDHRMDPGEATLPRDRFI
jgi:hypothetical protein